MQEVSHRGIMMDKLFKGIFFLCFLIILCCASPEPDDEWVMNDIDKAHSLLDKGDFQAAVSLLEKTFFKVEKEYGYGHLTMVAVTRELASAYEFVDETYKAEELIKNVMTSMEKTPGYDELYLAELKFELANIYTVDAKLDKARSLYREVLAVYTKHLEPDDPYLIDLQGVVGDLGEPYPSAVTETTKSTSTVTGESGFEIIRVECPDSFSFDGASPEDPFPCMKVAYRLHSEAQAIEWTERFEVISPDGKIHNAGSGKQWYNAVHQGEKRTYEARGYSMSRNPGIHRFRLTLEGKDVETEVVEREFTVR